VELKNEVCIRGTLKSVDQYLNIKLDNAEATDELRWPHLVRTCSRVGPVDKQRGVDNREILRMCGEDTMVE